VWNLLDENRQQHYCNFWLLRGVIGPQPVSVAGTLYSTRTIPAGLPKLQSQGRQAYTFEEIQSVTNITLTALLIDCEGCIETLFEGNKKPFGELIKGLRTIILEADMPIGAGDCMHDCVDYQKWIIKFESEGLKLVHAVQDKVYKKIFHYVFQR
jgi:hypothetical protein